GPGRNRNRPPAAPPSTPSSTSWPVTSEGMRSGVNWTRLASRSSAAANALTTSGLATPGTPSSSTWPRASSAATRPDSVPSWPTTTSATSSRTESMAARGSGDGAADSGAPGSASDMFEDLLADAVDGVGQGHQRVVVRHRAGRQRPQQGVVVDPGAVGGHPGEHGRRGRREYAEVLGQEAPQVG